MFSKMGTYEPCGIFTTGHFILMAITTLCIFLALRFTYKKSKEEIHKIIKVSTIIIWILEIIKIVFSLINNLYKDVNTYLPLYYCSILLYAGLLSSFGKGNWKRAGDVCLATGALVGGIVFILDPSTTLPAYPAFHFLSIHSFLYHGTMVYLGLLLNITKYVELKKNDIKYFAGMIGAMCLVALIVNKLFNGNLMFISNNFPGTPIEVLYRMTKGGLLYNFIMISTQMTIPFWIVYYTIQKLRSNKKEFFLVLSIIVIQTVVFIIAGLNKSYLHMDEAYSLGLTNYSQVEIEENKDFFNNWHTQDYYEDYLSISRDEIDNFKPVYENQKNDVHPPLYYFLLRFAMSFYLEGYTKWTGIILNIIIYIFITIFMYLILKKLIPDKKNIETKSAIVALASSLTLASIGSVMYIRMYALATLNIVITTYLHMKLLDSGKNNFKLLLAIGISALVGSLTHYYFLIYLFAIFTMFVIKYIREKRYKELIKYIVTFAIAGILSLIIFPYSISQIFNGYRGQGVINNFAKIPKYLISIVLYGLKIELNVFNTTLWILIILVIILAIYKKSKKVKKTKQKNKYINYIMYPTIIYTVLVAIASPWIELRYIMPVCNLIFILVMYLVYKVLKDITKEKTMNSIFIGVFTLMLIMPFISGKIVNAVLGNNFMNEKESNYSNKDEITEKLINEFNLPASKIFDEDILVDNLYTIKKFKIEPETLYSGNKEVVKIIEDNKNVPALYFLNSSKDRFLDDILLFAKINESYIAKDIEHSEENIRDILKDKDVSNGIFVFINKGQDSDEIAETTKNALGLNNITYLKNLNACDLYFIK